MEDTLGDIKDTMKNEKNSPIDEFTKKVIQHGKEAEILKVGFFGGSVERFKEAVEKQNSFLQKVRKNFW